MPADHPRLTTGSREGSHGQLRGVDAAQSPQFEGKFGRMFRALPPAQFGDQDLANLAAGIKDKFDGMSSPPEVQLDPKTNKPIRDKNGFLIPTATKESDVDDEENFGIPAGYTYLGQFIDHDITFDPASSLQSQNDPDALIDFRTPALDLDNLYGRGPADQPYMYEPDGIHFAFGRDLTRNGKPSKDQKDLLRSDKTDRALIGDKRNDENVIVSQLQGVFLGFHNFVANTLLKKSPGTQFEEIQRFVRWHYQWIVLHDFLPRIVGLDVVHSILPHLKNGTSIYDDKPELHFYAWRNDPFMPVEFSVAAYRFGHSMVRPIYRLNEMLGSEATPDEVERGVAGRQFIFAAVQDQGLNGFRKFPDTWAIDWNLFFETRRKLDDPGNRGPGRVQPAYKIDSSLVNPLAFLPEFSASDPKGGGLQPDPDGHLTPLPNAISNLAHRNLLRGMSMGLPSGQAVARHMGLEPIPDDQLRVGKANVDGIKGNRSITDFGKSFTENAPLWFYILAEAQHQWLTEAAQTNGDDAKNMVHTRLGPVGGRIVAEVLIGLMLGDQHSFLSQWPTWKPWFATADGKFGMPELLKALNLG
jgi:Animal haem peroxidase